MKTIIVKLLVVFLSLSFITVANAQDDTKEKKKDKSSIKTTVDSKIFPKKLGKGESFEFSLGVENKSKSSDWLISSLTFENDPNFKVIMSRPGKPILGPGESDTYFFSVTAPDVQGKEKLVITFYNDGKKKRQIVKNIKIGMTDETLNEGDDDSDEEAVEKEDDNKQDDKNMNKEKEKDKGKEKNKEKNKNKNKESD